MAKMRYSRRNRYVNAARSLYNVGTAVYGAYRQARSFTKTRKRRNVQSTGITFQKDSRVQYRRKSMPRRARKRWIGFCRKVRAATMKELGSSHYVRNTGDTVAVNVDVQVMTAIGLYGITGNDQYGFNDVNKIVTEDAAVADSGSRLHFMNGVLDMTFCNTAEAGTMELDVYEFYVRREVRYNYPGELWTQLLSDTGPVGATPLATTTLGVTPFDIAQSGNYFRIVKKTKYFLSAGAIITYQMRDQKNRVFNTSDLTTDAASPMMKPGWTKGVILTIKGTPDGTNKASATEISFSATRSYNYKHLTQATYNDGTG